MTPEEVTAAVAAIRQALDPDDGLDPANTAAHRAAEQLHREIKQLPDATDLEALRWLCARGAYAVRDMCTIDSKPWLALSDPAIVLDEDVTLTLEQIVRYARRIYEIGKEVSVS